jgi:tryptophanyl-tRNA synthetase
MKKNNIVALTCLQPNKRIHLGNYFGTILNWKKIQKSNNRNYFGIANMHSLTSYFKYGNKIFQREKNLKEKIEIIKFVAQCIASGINPKKTKIFIQSEISENFELFWILSCMIPIQILKRIHHFRNKIKDHKKFSNNLGLLSYPILQASDILLQNANIVPVGEDQKQHLEITQNLAKKFNNFYSKKFFNIPKAIISKEGGRIKSIINPLKKMSKSDNENSCIFILDSSAQIKKKILSAKTNKDGILNLINIYRLVLKEKNFKINQNKEYNKNKSKNFFLKKYKNNYLGFKKELIVLLIDFLKPIKRKYRILIKHKEYIEKILNHGNINVKKNSAIMMKQIYKMVFPK